MRAPPLRDALRDTTDLSSGRDSPATWAAVAIRALADAISTGCLVTRAQSGLLVPGHAARRVELGSFAGRAHGYSFAEGMRRERWVW
jgi:hypothetical protein